MPYRAFMRCRTRGFTLVETLVALLVLGLLAGLASLDPRVLRLGAADDEAERLRQVLEQVADQAALRGSALAVDLGPDGYRVSRFDPDGGWTPLHHPATFSARRLPADWRITVLEQEGQPLATPARLVFGLEMPRFRLQLTGPRGPRVLAGHADGSVRWERP